MQHNHHHHQSRHPLLAILALAALALAVGAPNALAASQNPPPGPPNFPTAIPTHPGALTYSTLATTTPLAAQARPISINTNDGIAPLPFALALAGALIAGFAASSSLHLLHGRRRRAGQPS